MSLRKIAFVQERSGGGGRLSHFCLFYSFRAIRLHLHPLWRQQHVVLLSPTWWRSLRAGFIIRPARTALLSEHRLLVWMHMITSAAHTLNPAALLGLQPIPALHVFTSVTRTCACAQMCRYMSARWTHGHHRGRSESGCANKSRRAELDICLTERRQVRKAGGRLELPDSGRRIPGWTSYTSCSTLRPRRQAHEEHPHCCCMKWPGVQDTDGRKGEINKNEYMCGYVCESDEIPARQKSMNLCCFS